MLESLSMWIRQVILVVMFTVFVDFLMPSSNLQKYVRVVLGIVVMITILNPVIVLLKGDIAFTRMQLEINNYLNQDQLMMKTEEFKERNIEMALDRYKKELENLIAQQVKNYTLFEVSKTDIKIDQSGRIEQIRLTLQKADDRLVQKGVEKVSVKLNPPTQSKSQYPLDKEVAELKEYLSKFYEIPEANIHLELEGDPWKAKLD
ncbi:stage III sporulation protein AF [Thermosediminibacter litoriperuensis]|uniref:Stage III sporulation protein AF n=1 Tax=Thermosediminibacter litoriperuensis TaxID=291989 RepID=A0A5S5AKQ8_9FIRM|nr:stage III sporulation protein AF [Thermosediminibacter litoriperuensis]TYP51633.1 stage III sporulation protein AF [Thermosediminibacter litoriperuensis]